MITRRLYVTFTLKLAWNVSFLEWKILTGIEKFLVVPFVGLRRE